MISAQNQSTPKDPDILVHYMNRAETSMTFYVDNTDISCVIAKISSPIVKK